MENTGSKLIKAKVNRLFQKNIFRNDCLKNKV